ncbi:uncharacterized protein LOC141714884 [Apium graveolens]|uniref:uncharacterized protein LOC141714884 n=1 Tax=Apium graveolens TaxID=4045 RepID=UPI003D7B72E9
MELKLAVGHRLVALMPPPCSENIEQNVEENFAASQVGDIGEAAYNNRGNLGDDCDKDSEEFKRFLADAEQPLFECSDSSKLDSMLKLHNWKARFGISESAFTYLLSSVGSLLPKDHVLPSNAYTAKKTLSDLGLEYIKIHACLNECILYRGVNSDFVECPKCHISRWKLGKDGKVRVNVPAKVMWYFPIIPRFKWMFKLNSTVELLTWHANQRIQEGQMRHPADSPSWRNVDYKWPEFGNEPRNLRLAMVAGVSGPQEPGNNIDIFLQPLIDDLKKFWKEGEPDVYDAHTKSSFTLRAILMWTINDFPAYGNLSGCVNKDYMCCPVCGDNTVAKWMYPFERFNKVLKSYVRNCLYPEGCIADSYIGEDSVEFCSKFVRQSCTTAGLPKDKAKLDGPLSPVIIKSVEEKERDEAHLHVLQNNSEVYPYITWFEKKVSEMIRNGEDVPETIRWLAGKPSFFVLTYEGFLIDGVQYFTKDRDNARVVQNSGASLVAKTVQVSSAKDLNLVESDMTFYGVIEEIWELDYRAFKAPLFLCRWADSDRGVKFDDLGFTLVKQVFYVDDPVDITWSVVLTSTNRDYHEVYNDDDLGDTTLENPPLCSQILKVDVLVDVDDDADEPSLGNQREDVEGIWIRK